MLDGRGRWRNFNQAGHAAQKKATRSDGLEVGLPNSGLRLQHGLEHAHVLSREQSRDERFRGIVCLSFTH
jgi:hypothetical protein